MRDGWPHPMDTAGCAAPSSRAPASTPYTASVYTAPVLTQHADNEESPVPDTPVIVHGYCTNTAPAPAPSARPTKNGPSSSTWYHAAMASARAARKSP